MAGDLAPTFSNIYPEILDPWVSEQDFRFLIQTVNDGLIKAFKPGGWRAWVDTVLGVATGWLWEDFGAAAVKAEVRGVEGFIEDWNGGRESGSGEEVVKVVSLRRTGFLSVSSNSVSFFHRVPILIQSLPIPAGYSNPRPTCRSRIEVNHEAKYRR